MPNWDAANLFAMRGGPQPFERGKQLNEGESRNDHFQDAAGKVTEAVHGHKHNVHNGMNEEPDIPRFGADG